jgi:hypothetical protein
MKLTILFTAVAMMLAMSSLHSQTTTSGGAEATPTQAEEAAQSEKASRGSVSGATFTTAILDGEPTDYRQEIENSGPVVYFFAELDGMEGQTATHRWKYHDKVMAEAKIAVKSSRFASWSSNKMPPESTGLWIVEVLNGNAEVIATHSFNYLAPL